MPTRLYLVCSATLFGLVALLHLVRALAGWAFVIGPLAVPAWLSWTAVVVAGALCAWGFALGRGRPAPAQPA